jgi:hypothetical protein
MGEGERERGNVRSLTKARAKRGELPWGFTVDVAADHYSLHALKSATPLDLVVMADKVDETAKTLRVLARQIRKLAALKVRERDGRR